MALFYTEYFSLPTGFNSLLTGFYLYLFINQCNVPIPTYRMSQLSDPRTSMEAPRWTILNTTS